MMDPPASFQDVQASIQSALVGATRTANQLAAEDLAFHRTFDRKIAVSLDRQNARLLALAERLLQNAAEGSEVDVPKLRDADAVENNWRGIVDVIDTLLEKTDTTLDEFTGAVKRLTPREDQSPAPKPRSSKSKNLYRTQDLAKPQKFFEHGPQNDDTGPFRPLLTSKPHATISLEDSLHTFIDKDGFEQFAHPYQTEIENYNYPPAVYTKADPIPPQPFEITTATFVETPEQLAGMLAELRTAKEIAIDLEHHETRSYIGIVSLMQISTRNKDWVIDTLRPWRRKLQCLNEVFADPTVVKVLHGAYMDAVWLQRDLGLYLVGLFDTHWAARALGYAGGSLAFLLQKFVNFEAQKQYQMADWRIRPLPKELFDYARSDTHFLLYIYDNMRNELVDRSDLSDPRKDKIRQVLEKSKETALQRYETPVYEPVKGAGPVGWLKLISRTPAQFSREQFAVFRAVHQWRDSVARQEDESTSYVIANHALFSIARTMPSDKAALFSVSSPVSPILRLRANEVITVIAKAKAEGANGPELADVLSEAINRNNPSAHTAPDQTNEEQASSASRLEAPISTETLPARSGTSKFWGQTIVSNMWEQKSKVSDITLALPLPPLTADIFAQPADTIESAPGTPTEHTFMKKSERPAEDEDDGIFIIKQLGGARKRKLQETTPDEAPDDPWVDGVRTGEEIAAEELARAKAQRKAEKKAARKLKKQQRLAAANSEGGAEEEMNEEQEPFDYDNAPSVLHAHEGKGAGTESGKRKRKEGGFNPFKKAMDAPKGLRRVQKEAPGRSATFRE